MAMPASIQREAMAAGKIRDDLIPTARVESSSVAQEDGRILAGPFKKGNFNSIDRNSALDGHF
jgi:hypothetical protein